MVTAAPVNTCTIQARRKEEVERGGASIRESETCLDTHRSLWLELCQRATLIFFFKSGRPSEG